MMDKVLNGGIIDGRVQNGGFSDKLLKASALPSGVGSPNSGQQ